MFVIYENAVTERKDNETTKSRTFVFDTKDVTARCGNVSFEGYDVVPFDVKRGEKVYADRHPIEIK